MKRRLTFVGAIATVATLVVVLASLVPASSQQATTKSFAVCEVNNTGFSKVIDAGKHGYSSGDYVLSSVPAYNPGTGKRVATDISKLTVVNRVGKRNARFIVDATMAFKAGKVSVYGPGLFSNFGKGVNFGITGGTGTYKHASGTAFAKNGGCRGKRGLRISFNLTLQ